MPSSIMQLTPADAKRAWDSLEPTLAAIPNDQLAIVRADLQRMAAIAHSVAARDAVNPRRALFDKLVSAQLLPADALDVLALAAGAAWYARYEQSRAEATASSARIPETVQREASAVRARMLRVLSHFFDDDGAVAQEIEAVRAGTGYLDLANDLTSLANLYARPAIADVIATDPKHYRARDVRDARSHASTIMTALGLRGDNALSQWTLNTQRAWTHLQRAYEKVARAGVFLFSETEDTSATYPSLIASARTGNSGPAPEDDTPPVDPPKPA